MVDYELLKKLVNKVHWCDMENQESAKEILEEINGELNRLDEIRKIVSDISTDDTQKIDKIDLLLAEGGL